MSSPLGGGGPISSAYIDITADPKSAERVIGQVVRALGQIDEAAEQAAEESSAAFRKLAEQAQRALRSIGGAGFQTLADDAEAATEDVQASFAETQRRVNQILRDIGGPELFDTVQRQASSATEGTEDEFAELQRQANAQLRQIGGPGTFAGFRAQAEAAAEGAERSFRDSAADSTRAMASIGTSGASLRLLSTGFGAVGLAATIAGGAIVGFGLQSAATLEQTTIGFTALLGSAEAADQFIREMQRFAANTPFEFQGLADNARRLLAIGEAAGFARQDVIPLLTTLGDITSVLGAPQEAIDRIITAFGQMASRGKATTEEMLQLAEALPGFPVFQVLAEGLGVTTARLQEMLSEGAVPAREAIALLVEGMGEFPGAAGAMAQQAQTLMGVFSTFKDTISLSLTGAFQPLIPAVKENLVAAVPLIETSLDRIAPPLANLTDLLMTGLLEAVRVVGPALGGFLDALAAGLGMLGPSGAAALSGLGLTFTVLAPLLREAGDALVPFVETAVQLVNVILPPLANLFGGLIRAITPVLEAAASLAITFVNNLAPALNELVPPLLDVADILSASMVDALAELEPVMPDLAASFGELAVALADLLVAVTPLLTPLLTLTARTAAANATDTASSFEAMGEIINSVTPLVREFSGVLGELDSALGPVDEVVGGIGFTLIRFTNPVFYAARALEFLALLIRRFGVGVLAAVSPAVAFMGVATTLRRHLDSIVDAFGAVAGFIGGGFASAWSGLIDLLGDSTEALGGFLTAVPGVLADAATAIGDFFTALPGVIAGFLVDIGSWLITDGARMLLGLAQGMTEGFLYIRTAILLWPVLILRLLADAGIWLIERGLALVAGLQSGIIAAWPAVRDWFIELPGVILGFFASVGIWLASSGTNLLQGLYHGVLAYAPTVWAWFIALPGVILGFFAAAGSWLWQSGSNIITGLWNGLKAMWAAVRGWWGTFRENIQGFFSNGSNWLVESGKNIIRGIWEGMKAVWRNVRDWIGGLKNAVVNAIKDVFGISSPARVMVPLGRAITEGLIKGIVTSGPALASAVRSMGLSAADAAGIVFSHLGGLAAGALNALRGDLNIPAAVERWLPLMAQALQITGQWSIPNLLAMARRMNQESGGNPFAINLWDSNAARGTPSMGLMQTIGPTFYAHAGEYASRGPYDPLANMIASIRYTLARYGNLIAGWGRPGGYRYGDIITRDQLAMLHAPEVVIPLNRPNRAWELSQKSGLFEVLARALPSRSVGDASGGAQFVIGPVHVHISSQVDEQTAVTTGERIASAARDALRRQQLNFTLRTA